MTNEQKIKLADKTLAYFKRRRYFDLDKEVNTFVNRTCSQNYKNMLINEEEHTYFKKMGVCDRI